jgi:hypothetical protein
MLVLNVYSSLSETECDKFQINLLPMWLAGTSGRPVPEADRPAGQQKREAAPQRGQAATRGQRKPIHSVQRCGKSVFRVDNEDTLITETKSRHR